MIPLNDLRRHTEALRTTIGKAIGDVLDTGYLVLGKQVQGFEEEFAAYCGVGHGIGVANGTDALELALRALGCQPGDRVATVANAGMYATTAILAIGAQPVFVDVDPQRRTMAPAALAAIVGECKAVVVTHLYGQMADMPALLAATGSIPVVEDCAQAHGAILDGRRAGAWGRLGCFSFFPTKNLGAVGDGGAVVTSDSELSARLRQLRQYGWAARYEAVAPGGRNSRLDEIQAAVLRVKLPHLDRWNQLRQVKIEFYRSLLAGSPLTLPFKGPEGSSVGHLCVVAHPARDRLRAGLTAAGINTEIHYPIPDYRQPAVRALLGDHPGLPHTEALAASIFTLPCFPELLDEEARTVGSTLRRLVDNEAQP